MPVCFKTFCFNRPWQFTPFLNLRSFPFCLTPFDWLCTLTLQEKYELHGVEQNQEDAPLLNTASVIVG
jgi:hypothetical protein